MGYYENKGLLSKMQQMLDVCGRKIAVFKCVNM